MRATLLVGLALVVLAVAGGPASAGTAAPSLSGGTVGFDGKLLTDPSPTLRIDAGSGSYDYQWQSCSYPNAVLADGPTAYFRLGEVRGATQLRDSSGLDQDAAAATNGTLDAPGAIAGDGDGAISFPLVPFRIGVNYFPNDGDELVPQDFPSGDGPASIEAWIDPSGAPHTDGYIASFGAGIADDALNLETYNTGSTVRLAAMDGVRRYIATSGSITAGTWYHVALTFDGASIRLYLNGALVGTFAEQGSFSLDPQVARIDASVPTSTVVQGFGGTIDDVAFYGSALGGAAIANHYNAGTNADAAVRCADIPGATSQAFAVPSSLSGSRIRGQVTAYDGTGTTTAWTPEDAMEGSVVVQQTPDLTAAAYGPEVVNGVVVDAHGDPVPSARVSLYADLSTRTKVFPPLLAETITDAGGVYSLQLQDSGMADAILSGSGGWMNFMMVVRGPGVQTTTFFTRRYDPAQTAWLDEDGGAPAPQPVTLTASGPLGGTSRALSLHVCPPAPAQLVATTTGWATLGELHTWTTETGAFTYTRDSSTQISIAVSSGLNGPWSLSGSATLSGGSAAFWQTWPAAGSSFAKLAQGSEQSGKYMTPKTVCNPLVYRVQPMAFLGGTNWSSPWGLSMSDGHCPDAKTANSVLMLAGSSWGRSNGNGHSYSGGLSVFGIGLTTSSSWSSSTTTSWSTKSTGATPGRYLAVCSDGTGGVWYAAERIYMGPWYVK